MNQPVLDPDGTSVIEVQSRIQTCIAPGCSGMVVRHALGGGQSVDRCTRCFRRYQVSLAIGHEKSRLRRMLDEFVSWQDED
jgi:hypothetical protein